MIPFKILSALDHFAVIQPPTRANYILFRRYLLFLLQVSIRHFFTKTEFGLKRLKAELHAGMFSTLPLTIVKGVSSKTENTVYPNCGILYASVRQMGCFINPINKLLCIKYRFGCYK